MKYIKNSTESNVTDENTRKLDEIVRSTKSKKDIGVRYMKSWEMERVLKEEGRREEQVQTERERKRAEKAESDLKAAQERIAELEAMLAGQN